MKVINLRAFKIKYICPTKNKGARIGIKDLRRNKNKIIPYEYATDTKREAIDYLNKIGILIKFSCEEDKFYYLLSDNFETDLK